MAHFFFIIHERHVSYRAGDTRRKRDEVMSGSSPHNGTASDILVQMAAVMKFKPRATFEVRDERE